MEKLGSHFSALLALVCLAGCDDGSSYDEPGGSGVRTANDIEVTAPGQLASKLDAASYDLDSIAVYGPIGVEDFPALLRIGVYGNLRALNLKHARVEGGKIPDMAFSNVEGSHPFRVYNVILPEGVTAIGECAFAGSSVRHVELPQSLRMLGKDCFSQCDYMREIVIPAGVEEIPDECFKSCAILDRVVLPQSIKRIGDLAFRFSHLSDINFPEGLEYIGKLAFSGTRIKRVELSHGLKLSDMIWTFENCFLIEDIVIADGVKDIPRFSDARLVKSLDIPASVEEIGSYTFQGCYMLTDLTLRDGLVSIGTNAFVSSPVQSLDIPSTVRSIGTKSFLIAGKAGKVTCRAIEPPLCDGSDAFVFADAALMSIVPLYVPAGSEDLYRAAEGWSKFKNITAL